MKRLAMLLAISMWFSDAKAQKLVLEPVTFNSKYSDFSPIPYRDGIVFCSNRKHKILAADIDSLQRYYTDMFYTAKVHGTYSDPKLFARELTGTLNEGPATFSDDLNTIYYTANIDPGTSKNRKKIKEYKLGLFSSQWDGTRWSEPRAFRYNDKKANIAHPALSSGDSLLFFISTKEEGYGGADLYMCQWQDSLWSVPVNMGPEINTPGNEMFPFFDESQRLYFSTDGRSEENGVDIYMSQLTNELWSTPVRLAEPINSGFDDFGYIHDRSGQHGFVCSNRASETDEIFEFVFEFPVFANCNENHKPIFCYRIEEELIEDIDSTLVVYEWDLGDGTINYGNSIEHCYSDTGTYFVTLNVLEKETNQIFYRLAEGYIEIKKFARPYIGGNKHLRINSPSLFSATDDEFSDFEAEQFYWDMGDGNKYIGTEVIHSYKQPGQYRISLGAVQAPDLEGCQEKTCSFVDIVVHEGVAWTLEPKIEFEKKDLDRLITRPLPSNEDLMSRGWQLIIATTSDRIPYGSHVLSDIRSVIKESFDQETNLYTYNVGPTETATELVDVFRQLAEAGIDSMSVVTMPTRNFIVLEPERVEEIYVDQGVRVVASFTSRMPYVGYQFSGLGVGITETFDPESGVYSYTSDPVENPEEIASVFESYRSSDPNLIEVEISVEDPEEIIIQSDLLDNENTADLSSVIQRDLFEEQDVTSMKKSLGSTQFIQSDVYDLIGEILASDKGVQPMFDGDNITLEATTPEDVEASVEEREKSNKVNSKDEIFTAVLETHDTDDLTLGLRNYSDEAWLLILYESYDRMPFNSPAFSSIEGDINECFNKQTELYTYSIGPTRSKEELLPLSAELADTGSMVLEVKSISAQHFEQERVKMTKYIAQGDVGALNREFRGFNDIHFEYNSFHIKEESFGNLDYIAAIFMLDSDFTIRVNGHTCNIGGETFNFRLSQRRAESVMSYLITKGISSKQLIAEGFGDKQPYATNSTEQGREQNRRVEFVIDMDGVKKLSGK